MRIDLVGTTADLRGFGPRPSLPIKHLLCENRQTAGRIGEDGLAAAKVQINRFGTPTATELQSSNDMIFSLLAGPSAQARRAKVRDIGYGVRSDFELNFGRYLPAFGQADDDDRDTQTD